MMHFASPGVPLDLWMPRHLLIDAAKHFRLLAEITSAPSLTTFRTRLETFLFTESYPDIRVI